MAMWLVAGHEGEATLFSKGLAVSTSHYIGISKAYMFAVSFRPARSPRTEPRTLGTVRVLADKCQARQLPYIIKGIDALLSNHIGCRQECSRAGRSPNTTPGHF
jgi:hypothetical protein